MNFLLPTEIENKIWKYYYALLYNDVIQELHGILSILEFIEMNIMHIKTYMRSIRFRGEIPNVERINLPFNVIERTRLQLEFIYNKKMTMLLPIYMRKIPLLIRREISHSVPDIYARLAYILIYRCNYQRKALKYFRTLLLHSTMVTNIRSN